MVTGGAGYIGSHTCKALSSCGHEPVVYDNLSAGHKDAVQWGPLEIGDILDSERLDAAMKKHQPEIVMHFASLAYVGESVADPANYYRINVAGSICLLEALQRNAIDNFILSSTCATYGVPASLPITESTPQVPINPYGFTKLVVERALADFQSAYGLNWVSLRYFNAAGCDSAGNLGERHTPETHLVPLAILASLGKAPPLKIYGTDYGTPDGTALRDYIHVSDLASAHVLALSYLVGNQPSCAFNLATGKPTSVLQILDAVEKATGVPVPVEFTARRPGDPPALYADAGLARDVMGWKPEFTDINSIVASAVSWFQSSHRV